MSRDSELAYRVSRDLPRAAHHRPASRVHRERAAGLQERCAAASFHARDRGVALGQGHERSRCVLRRTKRADGGEMTTNPHIIKTLFVVAVSALISTGTAAAADIAAGKQKAEQVCAACHGIDGNSQVADYPKIGGQYADYLEKALRDYKSGRRKNPIMAGMAAPLTAQDIENVAAYYPWQREVLRATFNNR